MNEMTKISLTPAEIEAYNVMGIVRSSQHPLGEDKFKNLCELTHNTIAKKFNVDQSGALFHLFINEPNFLDYAAENSLLDLVESLIGPDICLMGSALFLKKAASPRYADWHSDVGEQFEMFEKMHVLSVTIAITASTIESGCVRYLPYSHEKLYRRYTGKNYENSLFGSRSFLIEESEIDLSKGIVEMELSPGQCSFNNLYTIHSSEPNKSVNDRILVNFKYLSPVPGNGTENAQQLLKKNFRNRILVRGSDKGNFCNL